MNKRIKRKVTKRVLNKINDDDQLTKFEKRFFMKYLYPKLKVTVAAVVEALKKALPPLIEIATNKVNELEVIKKETYTDNKLIDLQTNMIDHITAGTLNVQNIDVKNIHPGDVSTIQLIVPEKHKEIHLNPKETKWQKAKGKMKGWFGK